MRSGEEPQEPQYNVHKCNSCLRVDVQTDAAPTQTLLQNQPSQQSAHQQEDPSCRPSRAAQEWPYEHDKALKEPSNSPPDQIKHLWDNVALHRGMDTGPLLGSCVGWHQGIGGGSFEPCEVGPPRRAWQLLH